MIIIIIVILQIIKFLKQSSLGKIYVLFILTACVLTVTPLAFFQTVISLSSSPVYIKDAYKS